MTSRYTIFSMLFHRWLGVLTGRATLESRVRKLRAFVGPPCDGYTERWWDTTRLEIESAGASAVSFVSRQSGSPAAATTDVKTVNVEVVEEGGKKKMVKNYWNFPFTWKTTAGRSVCTLVRT